LKGPHRIGYRLVFVECSAGLDPHMWMIAKVIGGPGGSQGVDCCYLVIFGLKGYNR
jgi:hypothetical protein